MQVRRAQERARRAAGDLRGPPRVVDARPGGGEPLAQLPRDRAQAGGARAALRLHARRAHADRRAPVLPVVGLPGDRLLRADRALRHAAGLHVLRRSPAPRGDRRHPRLDAGALPHRRARPHLLRRHAPLRARRPARGDARRVGERDLQLRPQRGAQLPHLERQLLARPLPHRRAAGRRGRLDALPRLRAEGRRVGRQPVRRQREPGGDRPAAHVQHLASTASTPTPRRSPRSRRRGRASRARPTRAASGSGSSGTWAGCTTRWPISRAIRSGAATTTTSSPSAACTSGARTTSCRCRTTRSSTASGRCCRRCTAISGSGSPTCACSTPRCGRSRGRSCCFKAARSASTTSGRTTAASTGTCSATRSCTSS